MNLAHIDPVARLESFRALKLSRLENILTLISKTLNENFRAQKLSWLENFRALKTFHSGKNQLITGKNNLYIPSDGLCC